MSPATAVFDVAPWMHQGLIVIQKLFKNSLETFLDRYGMAVPLLVYHAFLWRHLGSRLKSCQGQILGEYQVE